MRIDIDLDSLANNWQLHSRSTPWWLVNSEIYSRKFEFEEAQFVVNLSGFELLIPNFRMGSITSRDLFGLDELLIFSFYFRNAHRYKTFVDLGANIGVHTAVLKAIVPGSEVAAYEPDPNHGQVAKKILGELNPFLGNVTWIEKAVVPSALLTPTVEFVRVVGNTTSSHVKGAKANPYGSLEMFNVSTASFADVIVEADLVKMDVEGLEGDLFDSLRFGVFDRVPDFIFEVGTEDNARRIFLAAKELNLNLFSQKKNWAKVLEPEDVPFSYREGSIFATTNDSMNWAT